jgi:ATP-dependent Clp protease ATP-binding subunit ClpA
MDHATLTDNTGRKADFRHIVLIMTTNAGAHELSSRSLGFAAGEPGMGTARSAIEKTFSPEFRNRLDAWVAFDSLPPDVVARVVDKTIAELASQLAPKKVTLELTPEGRAWLAENGFDRLMGARPMARLVQNQVKKPLAEKILFGELKEGGHVVVGAKDGELHLTVRPTVPAEPAL